MSEEVKKQLADSLDLFVAKYRDSLERSPSVYVTYLKNFAVHLEEDEFPVWKSIVKCFESGIKLERAILEKQKIEVSDVEAIHSEFIACKHMAKFKDMLSTLNGDDENVLKELFEGELKKPSTENLLLSYMWLYNCLGKWYTVAHSFGVEK